MVAIVFDETQDDRFINLVWLRCWEAGTCTVSITFTDERLSEVKIDTHVITCLSTLARALASWAQPKNGLPSEFRGHGYQISDYREHPGRISYRFTGVTL